MSALAGSPDWRSVLDELPAPVYTTDAEGAVTYWNRACVEFAGREPQLGQDRWCVAWQLYTTSGDLLPHEECPTAEAIRTKQQVRDRVAIALRPDGTRAAFRSYPTPLFDSEGAVTGAVNIMVDISEEQAGSLKDQAERCRRLANATFNREVAGMLGTMARDYERTAGELANKKSA